jgi:UDP-galactose transporter
MKAIMDVACVIAATALMTAQPFAVDFSKNPDGEYEFLVLTTVVLSEGLKLVMSLAAYACIVKGQHTHRTLTAMEVVSFCLPALIYSLNNALVFSIISFVRPVTFQLLGATKMIFTAVLFRLVLKRILSVTHYAAMVILASGAAVSRLDVSMKTDEESEDEWVGVTLTLFSCVLSSLGGILNEALLKRDGQLHSLHLQNSLLYAWGVVISATALALGDEHEIETKGLFHGYDMRVLLLIVTQAVTGLSISVVLKLTSNIHRVFAHVIAILLSMLIDCAVTQSFPSSALALSVPIVGGAAVVYAREGPPAVREQSATLLKQPTEQTVVEQTSVA